MTPSYPISCDSIKGNVLHYKDAVYNDVFKVKFAKGKVKKVRYSFFKIVLKSHGSLKVYVFNKRIRRSIKFVDTAQSMVYESNTYIGKSHIHDIVVSDSNTSKAYSEIDKELVSVSNHTYFITKADEDTLCFTEHFGFWADTITFKKCLTVFHYPLDTNMVEERFPKCIDAVFSYKVPVKLLHYYNISRYLFGGYYFGIYVDEKPIIALNRRKGYLGESLYNYIHNSSYNMKLNPQKSIDAYIKYLTSLTHAKKRIKLHGNKRFR